MPTLIEIHEQIQEIMDAAGKRPYPAKAIKGMCRLIGDMARAKDELNLPFMGSEAERESEREILAAIARDMAEPIRLVREECERLRAEGRQRGLSDHEAEAELRFTLLRDLCQPDYQEIRDMVRRRLSSPEGPPVQEGKLQALSTALAMLAIDPSGDALHRLTTDLPFLDKEGEYWLDYTRRSLAREIELLDAHMCRQADAAEARGMSDDAIRRMIEAGINREFLRVRKRRAR
jgi:hypothetical protein